ncbi:TIGR04086 family membrane protein [Clostridium sp. AN503]|uniref:TIGR04086 family membrane protein n=1 Tax=Clostridium sp. AN503 TaxID=3160598 RepID=UPI00345AD24E
MSPSKPKALLRSLLISYLLSGILLLVMSFALYKLKLKEAQINTAVYAVYVIACLVGGILSGKALQNRRFFWGLLTGLLYFLVLFAVSWLMKQDTALDTSRIFTVLACCAAGGTVGGMVS